MRATGITFATMLGVALASQGESRAQAPDLGELRAGLDNPAISVEERARRALDGAASLDQAAQQATRGQDRRARWSEAVGVLDGFVEKHTGVESARLIRFQAGVYRWAEGRNLAEQVEFSPADAKLREAASQALDDATRRLREVAAGAGDPTEPFAQNVRFRLAQSIADRAKLDPEADPRRAALEREALALLDNALALPTIRPHARLLRGDLNNRLGLFSQAQLECDQLEKSNPPAPPEAMIEVRVTALNGRSQFAEAEQAIAAARVGEPLKQLLGLRVALARWKNQPAGPGREEFVAPAFRLAESLRGLNRAEARRGLMELARTMDEPGPEAPPAWWDLLAEGHLRLGDSARAGRLAAKGGDRAEAVSRPGEAASLRYKAGAYLFEAGKFLEADRRLGEVVNQPAAAHELRARAGMLRALARGRALANREPEASRAGYLSALETQVRDFPQDASTGEARWLLGQVRQAAGQTAEAMALYAGIRRGHPRWLAAQLANAEEMRRAVEAQRINRDSAAVLAKVEAARRSLHSALDEAAEGSEAVGLTLALARLELTPEVGHPTVALEACDRALKLAARPEQHQTARLYRLVALAQGGRAIEAERGARAETKLDNLEDLFTALRILDRAAGDAEAEATRRRFGLIARVLTTRIMERIETIPEASRDEVQLHHARALLFSGDSAGARKAIIAWGGPTTDIDDELSRELADTYARLNEFRQAIEAERYRSGRLPPGSLPWFESRYNLALAYFRADQIPAARTLIDSTAILHPDLGGGDLKIRYERLRQKLGQE